MCPFLGNEGRAISDFRVGSKEKTDICHGLGGEIDFPFEKELAQFEACLCLGPAPAVCQVFQRERARCSLEKAGSQSVAFLRVALALLYSSPVPPAIGPDSACLQIKHFLPIQPTDYRYVLLIQRHINATNYCILNPLEFVFGVPCSSFFFLSDEETADISKLILKYYSRLTGIILTPKTY